ncbi:MAG TPA: hypothetical protein ENH10_05965, partial [Bacteroidetes bacterium]|nr:hypothetical protein [Bacteroidota bacterium]HEX04690.1 hypothetical protein [Bacteroidota bacterium]
MKALRFVILTAIVAALGLTAASSFAEDVNIQGSNEMRWADGREVLGGNDRVKRYFEDRLNLNMYYGNLRVGSRFTLLQPSEFGEYQTDVNTLDKRFIEYSNSGVDLRVGNFYSVWGRGLGLALIEDILQGFDSGLDGMHGHVELAGFEIDGLAGRSEADYLGQVREAQVSAGQVSYRYPGGTSVIGLQGMLVTPAEEGILSYDESRTWAGNYGWDGRSVSLWAEYAVEDIEGIDDRHDAVYASASWFGGNLSLFADFKRYHYYRYSGGTSSPGSAYAASIDILPFHSPPIVQREFTSPLFSKHPHIVRFDDEVGAQIEASYNISGSNTITANYSQSSSFYEEDLWIPSIDEVNSPYRQVFVEYTGYPTMDLYVSAWGGLDEDLVYTIEGDGAVRARTSWLRRSVLGGGGDYQLADDWSLKVQAEGGIVEDVIKEASSIESITII